ncbi:phage tail assembly chaperone [uncultured Erythrobacter sp.]|uniref:phage tail assembly chaperone n=1 Tax=uncultured Erythrobacter sp. TaxID=263913 RepID=UPI00261760CA|nr:phage tail assembly chaperone [uncultured Erythrobacter sp.]
MFGDGIPLWLSLSSRVLGWRPADFWRSTPAELAGAIREPDAASGTLAPSQDLIAQLLERDSNG